MAIVVMAGVKGGVMVSLKSKRVYRPRRECMAQTRTESLPG